MRNGFTSKISHTLIWTVIPVWLLFVSCRSFDVPDDIVGNWAGFEPVTVRTNTGFLSFQFTRSIQPVNIQISISEEGSVNGYVGEAVFTECNLRKNRGWLGRKLNMKTDFIITGRLTGKIFQEDPASDKLISIPFNFNVDGFNATLFQKANGVYPMTSIQFSKIN